MILKYQDRIFGFCMTALSHRQEAEEAAQEVFVKAFRSLNRFKGESAFSTWLYRIAVNECRDFLRRRKRRHEMSLEELIERHGEDLRTMISSSPDSAGSTSTELVDALLSSLSADDRTLLTLREREGYSYAEIASILGQTVDAVKARLRRGRLKLREVARRMTV